MEVKVYKRKARRPPNSRRCLHWEHIKKHKGLREKVRYILKRLLGIQGVAMYSWLTHPCVHKGDGRYSASYRPGRQHVKWTSDRKNVRTDYTAKF